MIREVVLSKRAGKRLDILLNYLEENWSKKVKQDFIDKLDRAIEVIQLNPDSFPVSTKKKKKVHRCVVTKQNTIYYRYNSKRIEIIFVFDTRQNPKSNQY